VTQGVPKDVPPPDSEAVFVGYFYYHVAVAAEVERRREMGSQTGEVLVDNVCNTIGITSDSFWSVTPVIRDALAKLAAGNMAGVSIQRSHAESLPPLPATRSTVVASTVRELQMRLSPVEWDHLRSYLNNSFRARIHSQVVRAK
jgi:hypothetical protein